jgi:hypothetical protein
MYAIIAKNYDVEIYDDGRLIKIVKAALTYQQSVDYCKFQGLEIKNAR